MKNTIFLLLGVIYFGIIYYLSQTNGYYDHYMNANLLYKSIFSYLNALFSIFLSLGLINFLQNYLDKTITTIFKKTKSKYDDLIGDFIIKFINIVKYIIVLYISFQIAIIPENIQLIIDKGFNVSFIFAGLILLSSLTNSIFKTLKKKDGLSSLSKQVFPILNKIVNIFIWIIGSITIISNLGYNVSALITGAGVGGLAIALAAQKSVANIFGAISVILNKPFKLGDFISINGHTGTVKDIGLTYLTLADLNGHKILIPNENIISSSIENLSDRENRMAKIGVGLVYNTSLKNLEKAIKIIEDILEKEKINGKLSSYRVIFETFGDFSLNIEATYFSLINNDYTAYLKQKEYINLEIKRQFEKAKLDMAFPTREVILKKEA